MKSMSSEALKKQVLHFVQDDKNFAKNYQIHRSSKDFYAVCSSGCRAEHSSAPSPA